MKESLVFPHRELIALSIVAFFVFVVFSVPTSVHAQTACDDQYDSCMRSCLSIPGQTQASCNSSCRPRWDACVLGKCPNVGQVGACSQAPECELYCTEKGTSLGGNLGCCVGGPKIAPHQPNPCPNEIDGNCKPKKQEGKPPQLPKPPGGGGKKPSQPQEKCPTDQLIDKTDPDCKEKEDKKKDTGIASFLKSGFDTVKNAFGFGDDKSDIAKIETTNLGNESQAIFDPPASNILDTTTVENVTSEQSQSSGISAPAPSADGTSFESLAPPENPADPTLSGGENVLGNRTIAESTFGSARQNVDAAEAAREGFAEAESRGVFDNFLGEARAIASRVANFFLGR